MFVGVKDSEKTVDIPVWYYLLFNLISFLEKLKFLDPETTSVKPLLRYNDSDRKAYDQAKKARKRMKKMRRRDYSINNAKKVETDVRKMDAEDNVVNEDLFFNFEI